MVDDHLGPDAGNGTPDPAVPRRPEVWQEGTPGQHSVKLRGLLGAETEAELTVGGAGANNHSPSISDQKSPAGLISGLGVAWVEAPAGDPSGGGRIMWQSFPAGTPAAAIHAAMVASPANDNATWVTDLNGAGALGGEPTITGLSGGSTLITWIGADDNAHGRLYAYRDALAAPAAGDGFDAPEYAAVNAALADLGPVAAAPDGARRLQVAETRPGTFAIMWLALTEGGFALRGSLFLGAVKPGQEQLPAAWTEHPVSDIGLPPGFTGEFWITGAGGDSPDLVVAYADGGAEGAAHILARRIDGSETDGRAGQPGPEYVLGEAAVASARSDAPAPYQAEAAVWQVSDDRSPVQAPVPPEAGPVDPAATAPVAAAPTAASATAPINSAAQDGSAVAWQTSLIADGAIQIKLVLHDQGGAAGATEIVVTDNAAADVAPAIASLGSGIAAAYVRADDRALAVKAYDGAGAQIGEEAVVVPDGAIVEIAIGANGADEFAVVYVQAASDATGGNADYGSIMLQRYGIAEEEGSSQLVELGRDGEQDGNDGPVHLTTQSGDPAIAQAAVGRAPSVAGVDDGELVIIWVENDGARETIKGCAIEAGGGQVLYIDLGRLLEDSGIAEGTKPTLLNTGDGDFLVSWLQPDGEDGGYVVMAALYEEAGPGAWIAPEEAIRLKTFDSEPKDYSVAATSEENGLFIDVFWRQDRDGDDGDRVLSQRYDLDGHRLGRPTNVAEGDAPSTEQVTTDTAVAAAGLVDGKIIVAFAEQSKDGDLDLAAHIIDTSAGEKISSGNAFATGVNQEVAVNVLPAAGDGLIVSRVNGVAITTAEPVDVGSGWVQLREDGWLTISPDAGYTGSIAFDYTIAGSTDGLETRGHVTVNVEANDASPALALFNQVAAAGVGGAGADLKVADIALGDGALEVDGLSVAGLDAGMFKIVGTELYLKAGAELDFEAKPTLSVEIVANGASGRETVANFTLNIEANDAFVFAPDGGNSHLVEPIDLSATGYTTFQDLVDSGALVQAGDDVVIMLSPEHAADVHMITLKGMALSALSDGDFRFS